MSTKLKYKSIVGILHDKGININFKKYDARTFGQVELDSDGSFDCTTRAMCTVFNIPYDKIFEKQLVLSKATHYMPTSNYITIEIAREYGYHYYEFKIPMNLIKFYLMKPTGRYILNMQDHLFAYIDGIVYDRDVEEYDELIKKLNEKDFNNSENYNDNIKLIKSIEGTWFGYLFEPIYGVYHSKSEDEYWDTLVGNC